MTLRTILPPHTHVVLATRERRTMQAVRPWAEHDRIVATRIDEDGRTTHHTEGGKTLHGAERLLYPPSKAK